MAKDYWYTNKMQKYIKNELFVVMNVLLEPVVASDKYVSKKDSRNAKKPERHLL